MDEFEDEDEYSEFVPVRFTWRVLVRAGLDFTGHVLEGARCAVGLIEAAVISDEMKYHQDRLFHAEVSQALEMLPVMDEEEE